MLRLCFGAMKLVPKLTCNHCIVLSVLPHIKLFKALFSVKTKTNTDINRKH